MIDFCGHVLDGGPHFREVGIDLDRNRMALAAGGIVKMNLSELIVNQSGAVTREAANIRAIVMECFVDPLGDGIVAKDADGTGATR